MGESDAEPERDWVPSDAGAYAALNLTHPDSH
jgi:hypothetical protein